MHVPLLDVFAIATLLLCSAASIAAVSVENTRGIHAGFLARSAFTVCLLSAVAHLVLPLASLVVHRRACDVAWVAILSGWVLVWAWMLRNHCTGDACFVEGVRRGVGTYLVGALAFQSLVFETAEYEENERVTWEMNPVCTTHTHMILMEAHIALSVVCLVTTIQPLRKLVRDMYFTVPLSESKIKLSSISSSDDYAVSVADSDLRSEFSHMAPTFTSLAPPPVRGPRLDLSALRARRINALATHRADKESRKTVDAIAASGLAARLPSEVVQHMLMERHRACMEEVVSDKSKNCKLFCGW